jgi:hypothetical protein
MPKTLAALPKSQYATVFEDVLGKKGVLVTDCDVVAVPSASIEAALLVFDDREKALVHRTELVMGLEICSRLLGVPTLSFNLFNDARVLSFLDELFACPGTAASALKVVHWWCSAQAKRRLDRRGAASRSAWPKAEVDNMFLLVTNLQHLFGNQGGRNGKKRSLGVSNLGDGNDRSSNLSANKGA